MEELWDFATIKPVINQIELHPLYVEHDTIDTCKKYGILMQSYSPFARFEKVLVEHPTVVDIMSRNGLPVNKVLLLWHL